ncbi:MAG: hypothetical protein HGA33_02145 [Candidatus Moranbacteria bacterium]|nr:hypothetical protein [Candidatus Moranbacteria bacterium]
MRHRNLFSPFCLLAVPVLLFLLSASTASGLVQDTDYDGLTDDGEVSTYHTDPDRFDTDEDGVSDGREVLDSTDPKDADEGAFQAMNRTEPWLFGDGEKFPWYVARAAGILAFVLLTLSSAFGLAMSSRAFVGRISGADVYALHRLFSFASLFAIVLHVVGFLLDGFIRMTWVEAIVPYLFIREGLVSVLGFDTRLPVALGVVAAYLVVVLILTAEFRAKMPPKLWRIVHYLSFVAYPLFVMHGFMSGTDSGERWMRVLYIASVALIGTLILVRIIHRTILPVIRKSRSVRATGSDPTPFNP